MTYSKGVTSPIPATLPEQTTPFYYSMLGIPLHRPWSWPLPPPPLFIFASPLYVLGEGSRPEESRGAGTRADRLGLSALRCSPLHCGSIVLPSQARPRGTPRHCVPGQNLQTDTAVAGVGPAPRDAHAESACVCLCVCTCTCTACVHIYGRNHNHTNTHKHTHKHICIFGNLFNKRFWNDSDTLKDI